MSPRTPVLPLILALALWAAGLASSSRGLERCAAGPSAPWMQDVSGDQADRAVDPPELAAALLAAGDSVTPAEARRGAEYAAEGPWSGDLPSSQEPVTRPTSRSGPSPGSPPAPLYLHQRSFRC